MRRILLSLMLALAFAGPGISGVQPADAADTTVTFTNRADPATLTVVPGSRVTFVNRSGERKRVRSEDGPAEFDSGNIESGASWSVVLDAPGTYAYVDDRDRDNTAYHGSITVSTAPQPATGSPGAPAPSPAPAPAAPATASVAVLDRSFSPATVTVAPGGTVIWHNQSGRDHTVSGSGFDSGVLSEGGRFSHTFASSGTFSYICEIHPEMRASVTVTGTSGSTQPGSPAAATPAPAPTSVAPQTPAPQVPATAPAAGSAAARHQVALVDYAFRPTSLSARVGDSVVWINQGRASHTATVAGLFDTGMFRAGEQRTVTLRTAGTFTFGCSVHPEMTGVLTVAAAAAGTIPSGPASAPDARSASPSPSASGPSPPSATPAPAPAEDSLALPAEVSVTDFAFTPGNVRISVAGTVAWRQNGSAPHTVSAADGSFDSGLLQSGATFTRQFDQAGTYRYVCAFHPQMEGTIEVVDGPSAAGDPDAGAGAGDGEQAAASRSTAAGGSDRTGGGALLAALLGGAALLAASGAFLYGGSRMVAAEHT